MPLSIPGTLSIASYIIYKDTTNVYAVNGITGNVDWSGTDASTIIQNAYSAAYGKGGGTLFIKRGTYNINTTINLQKNVNIIGEGYGTNLTNHSAGPIFQFLSGINDPLYTVIEKMTFMGGGTGTGPAIQGRPVLSGGGYSTTSYLDLRDLVIDGMGSHGLYFPSRFALSSFDNLKVFSNAGDGIRFDYDVVKVHMIGMNVSGNSGNGMYYNNGSGNFINLEQYSTNSNHGMYILNDTKSQINIMYTEINGSGYGLYMVGGSGSQINLMNISDGYYINPAIVNNIAYSTDSRYHFVSI